ncbi:MAG: DUF11 domain-containing protein, partial [Actinobacteria bacterium]|nr:DUF11 domain-containing protein [Actinomycetota bacterium]
VQSNNAPAAVGGGARYAGVIPVGGNYYMLGENGGNIFLGCLTPNVVAASIGTNCTGFPGAGGTGNSNGNQILALGGTQFVESVVVMGNGNVAFSTINNTSPTTQFGLFCINISGATVTNCSGGALGTGFTSSLTGGNTVDARALRPVVTNGTVTGFCYSGYGAATPTGCFDSSGAPLATTPAVPMPTSLTVSGMSAIPVPGESQVIYSTGATAGQDQLQCFDYATNATCGTSTPTGQSVYGATVLPNTSCVISYGANNAVGWRVWDVARQLQSSSPDCTNNNPTYSFSDPAARYCGPGAGVGDWADLTLTSPGVIGTGTVVTYQNTATGATLATVTVTAAMGGGTSRVTIPRPDGVSYATARNLTVTLETPLGTPNPGTSITASLANTTTADALPQLCYQVRVPVCNDVITNMVNANGVGAFTDTGEVGLNCDLPPELTIEKQPTPETISAVGQTVTYHYIVTNIGGLPATNVDVTDTQTPPATQGNLSAISCPQTTLQPLESTTCTATYTPTQADLDNGSINDIAHATGTDPQGNAISSDP